MKTLIAVCSVLVLLGCVKVNKTNYVEVIFAVQSISEEETEVCGLLTVVRNGAVEHQRKCQVFPADKIPQLTIRWEG